MHTKNDFNLKYLQSEIILIMTLKSRGGQHFSAFCGYFSAKS